MLHGGDTGTKATHTLLRLAARARGTAGSVVGVERLVDGWAVVRDLAAAGSAHCSKAFHAYLVNRIVMQTAELKQLGSANVGLTDDNFQDLVFVTNNLV